ncbi:hypothetical protein pb186bvf_012737 [Paramecium bursaria]
MSHIQLIVNLNNELMNIQSKETQLINVLNKIKTSKQLEQNLYAFQNFSLIDEKILVSKLKGEIDVLTFDQLLKKYSKLIEKCQQMQYQDESIVLLPQKQQYQQFQPQQQQQGKFPGKDSMKNQLDELDRMRLENELNLVKQNLIDSQSKSEKYYSELNEYKNKIWSFQSQVNQLEFEKTRNLEDIKKLETKLTLSENYNQELIQKLNQNRIDEVDNKIRSSGPSQQNQFMIDNLKLKYEENIKGLNNKIEDLKASLEKKDRELYEIKLQQKTNENRVNQIVVEQKYSSNNNYEISDLNSKLESEQKKCISLEQDFKKQLKENESLKSKISDFEIAKQTLTNQINNQEIEVQQQKLLLERQKEFNKMQEQNLKILNDQYIEYVKRTKEAEQKYSQNITNLQEKLLKMKNKQNNEPKVKDNLEDILVHIASNMMITQQLDNFAQQFEKLRQQNQNQSQLELNKIKQKQEELDRQKKFQHEKEQLQNQEKLAKDAKKNENIKYNQIQAQKTHGSIDICFVMDCTQSMDPHKENVIKCINQAIQLIKSSTNRDCNWAAVAYKDVDYLQATKNQFYPEQDFDQNPEKVQQFLKNQKCSGGADLAEDLQLGLRQAVNLSWKSAYRVVMVITDAPCHGAKYYENVSDDFADRTIEEELDMIIKQKIYFIGINLPSGKGSYEKVYTKKMFEYFIQYFAQKFCLDKIDIMDYNKDNNDNMFKRFTAILKQAAEAMTQVTNKNTKTKNQQPQMVFVDGQKQMLKSNCDGAVQALCKKMPDPTQFDKMDDVKIKQCKFTVYRSEFKQVAFERCINRIWDLGNNKDDYNIQKEETQWECVRTQIHFAEGQMKKVYLMKRFNREQEVYVIKSPISGEPYQSFDKALRECRSHLIAKLFMKRFKETCLDYKEEKRLKIEIPQVQYSDFLILEEDGKQFWIAERFFKGEFVKYNNNNGYIDDSKQNVNNFSQAFSIFTYYDSESTMMICDIQGMGPYFTDPAINTIKGGFDETDIGEEGINNYLVNFKGKKIGYEYIDLLDIQLDK